jgi:hypothetical protein
MIGQAFAQAPIFIVTGNFTVQLGNTTYIITGAQLISPDPDGQARITLTTAPCDARCNSLPGFFGPLPPFFDFSNSGTDYFGLPPARLTAHRSQSQLSTLFDGVAVSRPEYK